jgi:signal transduction histidine kinase
VQRLHETVVNAVHELRALLLDLHPIALSEKGLAPALTDLCTSYRARLGINIDAHLTPVPLDTAGEHAVLRVA